MKGLYTFLLIALVFLFFYFVPFEHARVQGAVLESFYMAQDYARKHVLLCLIPAFFIAGALSVFIKSDAILKYLGPQARKLIAYPVASISGTILAVCSCTVLPLFAGIYKKGAGIGPATAFLYSGPAINVLAIIMTARVLGFEIGIARVIGAVSFSLLIGILMQIIFKDKKVENSTAFETIQKENSRSGRITLLYFFLMVSILVFANWAPGEQVRLWNVIYSAKWHITALLFAALIIVLFKWFSRNEIRDWGHETWIFARQILPLLFGGVLLSGFLLGRPGHAAMIPEHYINSLVGGNSIWANLGASVAGAFMYFATLTEIPILQSLMGAGMGKGPALALLLAGPALSLPSMLVIRNIMGTARALTYILLVIILSTLAGLIYGSLF